MRFTYAKGVDAREFTPAILFALAAVEKATDDISGATAVVEVREVTKEGNSLTCSLQGTGRDKAIALSLIASLEPLGYDVVLIPATCSVEVSLADRG